MASAGSALLLASVCLLLGLAASGRAAEADCPAQCRCGPMSSDKTAQNWIIALSAHRQQRLIVGPGRNYHRADAGEAGYRQMTCIGLFEMPSSVPADVKKLMIYGDRYAPQPHRLPLHDYVKTGHVDWDKEFSIEEGPAEQHGLKQLTPETLAGARELQELFIEGNDIQMLQPEAFAAVPKLRLLSFRKNRLKELSAESLKGSQSLRDADFSSNEIRAVNAQAFSHVANLRTLSLSSNLISSISVEHMSELADLRELDVSGNRLHDLDSHVFSSQRNLTVLNLSRNRIASLDSSCFAGLDSLQSLQLAENGIHDIAKGAFASLASLRALDLSGNGLEQLTHDVLAGMPRLEELNLERNYISSIALLSFRNVQQLRVLKLGYNLLGELDASTFAGLQALHVLRLESNAISELDNTVLRAMPVLRELALTANRMTAIGKGTFRGLTHLRELHLERNQIKHADDEAFAAGAAGQLSKLGWLFLDGNRLRAITPRTFSGVPYLRHLSLSANDIGIVDVRAFLHNRNLVTLVLADNRLAALSPNTFSRQRALRVLNVAGNGLAGIESGSLAGLRSLEELLASANRIAAVSADALADLAALTRLDMSKNALTSVDLDSLLNGTRLQYLDLSNNRLRAIAKRRDSSAVGYLKILNVADNALETIDEAVATTLMNGSELHLNGNPWRCDCHLQWLRQLSINGKTTLAHAEKVVCKVPDTLSGREIALLQPGDLDCAQANSSPQKLISRLICKESPDQLVAMSPVQKRSRKDVQGTALTVVRQGSDSSSSSGGDDSDSRALCHGFVLRSSWALTTASCWGNVSSNGASPNAVTTAAVIVIIGAGGSGSGRRASSQLSLEASVVPHPGYSSETGEHDVAAVRFSGTRPLQSGRQPLDGSMARSGSSSSGSTASADRDGGACILDHSQLRALVSSSGRGSAAVAWAAAKQVSSRRQDVEPIPFRVALNETCLAVAGRQHGECPALLGRSLLRRRGGLHLAGASLRYDLLSHWGVAGFYAPQLGRQGRSESASDGDGIVSDVGFVPLFPYAEWLQQTMQEGEEARELHLAADQKKRSSA